MDSSELKSHFFEHWKETGQMELVEIAEGIFSQMATDIPEWVVSHVAVIAQYWKEFGEGPGRERAANLIQRFPRQP